MSTANLNVSLSEELKAFVDARTQARGYSSASDYMRDLVRRDEECAKEERFKALIEEGLASPIDPRTWEEHRGQIMEKINQARVAHAPRAA